MWPCRIDFGNRWWRRRHANGNATSKNCCCVHTKCANKLFQMTTMNDTTKYTSRVRRPRQTNEYKKRFMYWKSSSFILYFHVSCSVKMNWSPAQPQHHYHRARARARARALNTLIIKLVIGIDGNRRAEARPKQLEKEENALLCALRKAHNSPNRRWIIRCL